MESKDHKDHKDKKEQQEGKRRSEVSGDNEVSRERLRSQLQDREAEVRELSRKLEQANRRVTIQNQAIEELNQRNLMLELQLLEQNPVEEEKKLPADQKDGVEHKQDFKSYQNREHQKSLDLRSKMDYKRTVDHKPEMEHKRDTDDKKVTDDKRHIDHKRQTDHTRGMDQKIVIEPHISFDEKRSLKDQGIQFDRKKTPDKTSIGHQPHRMDYKDRKDQQHLMEQRDLALESVRRHAHVDAHRRLPDQKTAMPETQFGIQLSTRDAEKMQQLIKDTLTYIDKLKKPHPGNIFKSNQVAKKQIAIEFLNLLLIQNEFNNTSKEEIQTAIAGFDKRNAKAHGSTLLHGKGELKKLLDRGSDIFKHSKPPLKKR